MVEPVFLPDAPPKNRTPESRTWYITLVIDTQPPPATCTALERGSGMVVSFDVENFDDSLYAHLETHVLELAAAYERDE